MRSPVRSRVRIPLLLLLLLLLLERDPRSAVRSRSLPLLLSIISWRGAAARHTRDAELLEDQRAPRAWGRHGAGSSVLPEARLRSASGSVEVPGRALLAAPERRGARHANCAKPSGRREAPRRASMSVCDRGLAAGKAARHVVPTAPCIESSSRGTPSSTPTHAARWRRAARPLWSLARERACWAARTSRREWRAR